MVTTGYFSDLTTKKIHFFLALGFLVVVHVLFNRINSSRYLVFVWYLCLLVNGDVDIQKISQIFQEE